MQKLLLYDETRQCKKYKINASDTVATEAAAEVAVAV